MDEITFHEKLLNGFTEAELEAAFAKVKPATHWKDPIDALVALSDAELAAVRYAVPFYTATEATITLVDMTRDGRWKLYRVTADGYRAGPAGDH